MRPIEYMIIYYISKKIRKIPCNILISLFCCMFLIKLLETWSYRHNMSRKEEEIMQKSVSLVCHLSNFPTYCILCVCERKDSIEEKKIKTEKSSQQFPLKWKRHNQFWLINPSTLALYLLKWHYTHHTLPKSLVIQLSLMLQRLPHKLRFTLRKPFIHTKHI